MKSKNKLRHNQLIEEIIESCKGKFNPEIPQIKKCLEQLIDTQYIERSEVETDTYIYLA